MSRRTRRRLSSTTVSLHWPGASWLHRLPVGAKLLALVAGSGLILAFDRPALSAGLLAAAVAAILSAGVPARVLGRQARPFVILVAVVVLAQVLLGRHSQGLHAGLRMLAVASLALAVTLTTAHTAMVAWLERSLARLRVAPARRFRAGLAVGLALRSLDHLGVVAQRVLDARRARGLQRSLRAFAVPTVVAAARFAHGVGEALEARGIADPDPPERGSALD
ncbi:MAG: energy-coupling factor transporter transmembrane protein EcfT [Thermoleophilia bacterium]